MEESGGSDAVAFVQLGLVSSDATLADWPHSFALSLRVSLSSTGALEMVLSVHNTGSEPLSFTTALHTYFRVADITQASVLGLAGTTFLDSLHARQRCTETADAVMFGEEVSRDTRFFTASCLTAAQVDRIYVGVPSRLEVRDAAVGRTFRLETRGLPDAVVWNPWIAKAAAMADFGACAVPDWAPHAERVAQATTSTATWCVSRLQQLRAQFPSPPGSAGSAPRRSLYNRHALPLKSPNFLLAVQRQGAR